MDWTRETTQLLGRFQPWHKGHTELFKRAVAKTGQVAILLREQDGSDSNPFDFNQRAQRIILELQKEGFHEGDRFVIIPVPNIVNITYGRDVGYKIEQEVFDEEIHNISATKIRAEMAEKGEI